MTEQDKNIDLEEKEIDTPETPESDTDDSDTVPTLDDYRQEKSRREKAEKTIVELKKQVKELGKKQSENNEKPDVITKAEYAMERFIDKNPELEEYREDLEKYVKRGFTLEEAKLQVLSSDKSIENRKKLGASNFTDSDGNVTRNSVTRKELEAMNQNEYNNVMRLVDQGKVTLIR